MNIPSHRRAKALSLAVLALALAACATHPKPQIIYNPDGTAIQYKRIEAEGERDFKFHFTRKVYRGFKSGDGQAATPSQRAILDQWGNPDYVRRNFRSLQDERVDEWIYMEGRRVFQFVDRQLVFDGELTDYEQLLLRKGRPDEIGLTVNEAGQTSQDLIYRNIILPGRLESIKLANGWIVHTVEGK